MDKRERAVAKTDNTQRKLPIIFENGQIVVTKSVKISPFLRAIFAIFSILRPQGVNHQFFNFYIYERAPEDEQVEKTHVNPTLRSPDIACQS